MKRIISLILVIATAFLTLTGCAYRYDKAKMSKYADFDKDAFRAALEALTVVEGDFTLDPTKRANQVNDTVAKNLLKVTDPVKSFGGNVIGLYDSVYFCYYAVDAAGNIFYGGKLDPTNVTNVQLGLSTVSGLYAEIQKKLLGTDIKDYVYTTSASDFVRVGDVVSVSYLVSWDDDDNPDTPNKSQFMWNQYHAVTGLDTDEFSKGLLNQKAQVGVELKEQFKVNEDRSPETPLVKHYSNVTVESIVKKGDDRTPLVASGDTAYVSYVLSVKKDAIAKENLPTEINGMPCTWKTEADTHQLTVSYEKRVATTGDAADTKKETWSFDDHLVGKKAGSSTSSIVVKNGTLGATSGLELTYSNVKVHWINESDNSYIEVPYKPYPDAYVEADKNEKTEKNIYGHSVRLNGVELTYRVFPVYYIDVVDAISESSADIDAAAALLLKQYFTTVGATKTLEDELTTEYVYDVFKDAGYKNVDKTITALMNELSALITAYNSAKSTLSSSLTALTSAQSALASTKYTAADDEYGTLKTNLENAQTNYTNAKSNELTKSAEVDAKIEEILGCKKDGVGAASGIVSGYSTATYDELDAKFRDDIRKQLSGAIAKLLKSSVTFKGKLPKKAVKEAYNAIMDSYQYDFYEGKYSTGSTTTSTETNYSHYAGDFNRFLIEKVLAGQEGGMKEAKAAIKAQAEAAVQEIMYVYIFTDMVEAAWDTELSLTKAEKKLIKENLEYQVYQMQMLYGVTYDYNVEDAYNGAQFDKVMEFLLTSTETTNEDGVKVDTYTYINKH